MMRHHAPIPAAIAMSAVSVIGLENLKMLKRTSVCKSWRIWSRGFFNHQVKVPKAPAILHTRMANQWIKTWQISPLIAH